MATAINVQTHPDFTIDQIIAYTGCHVPSPIYRENMRRALEYFQGVVPRPVLRQQSAAGPWSLRINGVCIKLLSWMQGIDFHYPVNTQRAVQKGDPLIAYKDPSRPGNKFGDWYTFPSTQHRVVGLPDAQSRMHKFKALVNFTCMQSTASDVFMTWVQGLPEPYAAGGGKQLFVWNASSLLEPA